MIEHHRRFGFHAWAFVAIALTLIGDRIFAQEAPRQTNRTDSLRFLCQKLAIGPGAVVADIGCGGGADSLVFTSIVGLQGNVLAEEIDPAKLKEALKNTGKSKGAPVVPILGQSDDPRLPKGYVDLAYMHLVFHHFANPRAMLEKIWQALKPGGYLLIVDQSKGPLRDLAPMEAREKEHHWTGETAVVRMAREAGFLFYNAFDESWHEKDAFALVFQRPFKSAGSRGDPNPVPPLEPDLILQALPKLEPGPAALAFFGLDQGRVLLPRLREQLPAAIQIRDVVIEEWITLKGETPTMPEAPAGEFLRTEKGELQVPADAVFKAVVFADAYHRLWQPAKVLERLRQNMPKDGFVAIVDRRGPDGEARKLAGHRRRISPSLVRQDLEKAGFDFVNETATPSGGRFIQIYHPHVENSN